MTNKYLPITISLVKRRCLIVGGGTVAFRKIDTLLNYEADITVVAPEPIDNIEYFAGKNMLKLEKRVYKSPEAGNYGIVIAASDDPDVNRQVARDCNQANVPVNVVDTPILCDFTFPAVVRRDCLTVAVATDGKAPFLAGHLKLILESVFPERWKKIAAIAAEFRKKVQRRWAGENHQKADCYNRFLNADWKTILEEMSPDEVKAELERLLEPEEE